MYKMPGRTRKSEALFLLLIAATLLAGYLCFEQAFLSHRLLPATDSFLPWTLLTNTDSEQNGRSTVMVSDKAHILDYDFTLSSSVDFSYASVALAFSSKDTPDNFIDFSKYSQLKFRVKCSPQNVLSFTTYAYDRKFTNPADALTFRIPTTFFSCNQNWQWIEIDLRNLDIPDWWLQLHRIKLYDRGYKLDQVYSFSFGASAQSPRDTLSTVRIADIEVVGRDWRFVYFFAAFAVSLWLTYGLWYFKKQTKALVAELEKQIQKDRPLVAYQQLTLEPHRNREKNAVLQYMATEYANPEISLELAISSTGINRAKINNILKEEVGLTFSAYLNKLRLTEAARLLLEQPDAHVSEIAFSVGYNNVSYFNKLFKMEYGCAPKTFKPLSPQKFEADVAQECA